MGKRLKCFARSPTAHHMHWMNSVDFIHFSYCESVAYSAVPGQMACKECNDGTQTGLDVPMKKRLKISQNWTTRSLLCSCRLLVHLQVVPRTNDVCVWLSPQWSFSSLCRISSPLSALLLLWLIAAATNTPIRIHPDFLHPGTHTNCTSVSLVFILMCMCPRAHCSAHRSTGPDESGRGAM